MVKDDIKWLITLSLSCLTLFMGGAYTYAKFISNDAVIESNTRTLEIRVTNLEKCSDQIKTDMNMYRYQMNGVMAKFEASAKALDAVVIVTREQTKSNRELAIAIARLEERLRLLEHKRP